MDAAALFALLPLLLLLILSLVVLGRLLSPQIYDLIILSMTTAWYSAALAAIPQGSRVLDVGIGTASALKANGTLAQKKRLRIVGVDYDSSYVAHATRLIASSTCLQATGAVVLHKSFYDSDLLRAANRASNEPPDELFDAVYFSGSFSLLPDQPGALCIASQLLTPGGSVYITQTFQKSHSSLLAAIKPLLRCVTTIDFGRLMLEADIEKICNAAGMRVVHCRPIAGSIQNGLETALLIICRPKC